MSMKRSIRVLLSTIFMMGFIVIMMKPMIIFHLIMILWKKRYRKKRKPEYFIHMEIYYLFEINSMEKH